MQPTYTISQKNIKGLKLVILSYKVETLIQTNKIPELQQCLFLHKTVQTMENRQNLEFWIYQPFWGKFELEYSVSPYFEVLQKLITEQRTKFGYKGCFLTGSMFVKDNQVITATAQDVSKHIMQTPTDQKWWSMLQSMYNLEDSKIQKIKQNLPKVLEGSGLDVREALKQFITIPSGTGYELNPGSHEDNHSEAKALYDFFGVNNEQDFDKAIANPANLEKLEQLKDSTCYLTGHWWSCKDCGRKMAKVGVKKVIINKNWVLEYILENLKWFD